VKRARSTDRCAPHQDRSAERLSHPDRRTVAKTSDACSIPRVGHAFANMSVDAKKDGDRGLGISRGIAEATDYLGFPLDVLEFARRFPGSALTRPLANVAGRMGAALPWAANIVGIADVAANAHTAWNTEHDTERIEAGGEAIMGGIGLLHPVGAGINAVYQAAKWGDRFADFVGDKITGDKKTDHSINGYIGRFIDRHYNL
jgi:hypothetical protein